MRPRITINATFRKSRETADNETRSSVVAALWRWWFQMVYEISDREL